MRPSIDLCIKFPAVLRNKLLNAEIDFPDSTRFDYEPIYAYRAVVREAEDNRAITREDFRSYFDLKKTHKRPRGLITADYERDAHYYGASCFTKSEIVEQKLKFPNPHKKLAVGFVLQEYGAEHTEGYHVCWWLYEGAEVSEFRLLEV